MKVQCKQDDTRGKIYINQAVTQELWLTHFVSHPEIWQWTTSFPTLTLLPGPASTIGTADCPHKQADTLAISQSFHFHLNDDICASWRSRPPSMVFTDGLVVVLVIQVISEYIAAASGNVSLSLTRWVHVSVGAWVLRLRGDIPCSAWGMSSFDSGGPLFTAPSSHFHLAISWLCSNLCVPQHQICAPILQLYYYHLKCHCRHLDHCRRYCHGHVYFRPKVSHMTTCALSHMITSHDQSCDLTSQSHHVTSTWSWEHYSILARRMCMWWLDKNPIELHRNVTV